MRQAKTLVDIRNEAAKMARASAREREDTGDPEGAGVLRDLAKEIETIRLTRDV